jgi:hypothetical protein
MSATAQKIVNRPAVPVLARQPVLVRSTPGVVQAAGSLKVSSPADPAEREAEHTARRIMRMPLPQSGSAVTAKCSPHAARFADTVRQSEPPRIARKQEGTSATSSGVASEISASRSSGQPLPSGVRRFMEPRFNADFSQVRIHTGEKAARLSSQVSAQAFTVGKQVFFGRNRFRPESNEGRELIAHELTHTIQQGAAIQRSADSSAVAQRSEPLIQRGLLSALGIDLDPRSYFAEKAASIPGFTMLTVVIGFNPITGASVDRSAGNILRGAIEMIPVAGVHISCALNNHGIFDKVSVWAAGQFKALSDIGSSIRQSISDFIRDFDITSPLKMLERGKQLIAGPVSRIKNFATSLKDGIVAFVKDAVLKPIAAFAKANAPNGYDLLCGVLGKDPISGETVARSAETLIGPFMKLIGQEEVWENMKKSNAIARAWAWFQNALGAVKGFVQQVPELFIAAFKSLEIIDIVFIPKAFAKLAGVFGGFAGKFAAWAGNAVWNLLEIIFDAVKPGLMGYIKKTGAALKGILKNPLPFVGNLVKAARLGFESFASNFGQHFKAGLIDWLTGSLVGVYIPKALSLPELGKFALSVLGISWAGIRGKIVKVLGANGEMIMKGLETTFDVVKALVTGGPAAAWELIKEKLNELKDTVINGIIGFVTETVIMKAVPKLIAMFIPGAGFISAIISIYDTIMVFVQKISKIIQVVVAFIDSIVAIAGGNITAAARRVESILGGLLSLAISFLAGFLGLGKITDKIKGIIDKVRDKVDKAIDSAIAWIVAKAKAMFGKAKSAVGKLFSWGATKSKFKDEDGHAHTVFVQETGTPKLMIASTPSAAESFLDAFLAKKSGDFVKDNAAKIAAVRTAAQASSKIVDDIAAKEKRKPNDPALPGLQQSLLNANVILSGALAGLINSDVSIGKMRDKYLLEGLTGTYGSMPKPKGDGFTADHQPQAAVLEAAAEFDYFSETGELAKRAAGRAKAGFAINLHYNRHIAGSTYGSKGKATKAGFLERIKPLVRNKKRAEQRAVVITEIKADLMRDVSAMKSAAAPGSANWDDIRKAKSGGKKEEKENLIKEVSGRIMAGEAQMAAQDINSLTN